MNYDDYSIWIDLYFQTNHNKRLNMTYEVKIFLTKLGIDNIISIAKKINKIKINFHTKLNFNII